MVVPKTIVVENISHVHWMRRYDVNDCVHLVIGHYVAPDDERVRYRGPTSQRSLLGRLMAVVLGNL